MCTVRYLFVCVHACLSICTLTQLYEYVVGLVTPDGIKFTHRLCGEEQLLAKCLSESLSLLYHKQPFGESRQNKDDKTKKETEN